MSLPGSESESLYPAQLRHVHRHCMFRSAIFRSARCYTTQVPIIYKPRKQPLISPTLVFVGFIPVLTFGLGVWQLQRLKWKVNLIDELQEKLYYPPLPLPSRVKYAKSAGCAYIKDCLPLYYKLGCYPRLRISESCTERGVGSRS
jgi:hypothetical protein